MYNIFDYGFNPDFNIENKNGTPAPERFESYKKLKAESGYSENEIDYRKQKQQWEKALRIGDKKRRKERF